MIAIDTNLVVRLLTNDDRRQAQRAAAVFASDDIFLPKTVLLETEWVLRYSYELDRAAILRGLLGVLGMPNVFAENSTGIAAALEAYKAGMDFADAMHVCSSGAASRFATFDTKLAKRAKNLTTVEILAV
jgi:predicted nucleic-acid-binding protein